MKRTGKFVKHPLAEVNCPASNRLNVALHHVFIYLPKKTPSPYINDVLKFTRSPRPWDYLILDHTPTQNHTAPPITRALLRGQILLLSLPNCLVSSRTTVFIDAKLTIP